MRDIYQFPFPTGARSVPYVSPPAPIVPFVCEPCSGAGFPRLEVRVDGALLPSGGMGLFLLWMESVSFPTALTLRNIGSAPLIITNFDLTPGMSIDPPLAHPEWFIHDDIVTITIFPGDTVTVGVTSTPNDSVVPQFQNIGTLTIDSNDPSTPNFLAHITGQARWFAKEYWTLPDEPEALRVPLNENQYAGTHSADFITDAELPTVGPNYVAFNLAQLPPCSGPWVMTMNFGTEMVDGTQVEVGPISLSGIVGSPTLSAQTWDFIDGANPRQISVSWARPGSPAFHKALLTIPSNEHLDSHVFTVQLYADWRVATAVVWHLNPFAAAGSIFVNGDTVNADTHSTDLWSMSLIIQSSNGPIRIEDWTLTPTHTEPGSTGAWRIYAAREEVDNANAPTLYTYELRIDAPFLLNNVTPQTADLTATIRKTDCTTDTRTVHIRAFGVPPSASITSRSAIDFFNGSDTQLGAGPTPALEGGEIEWWSDSGVYVEYAVQLSVLVAGMGHTYQWQRQVSPGVWANLANNASMPFISGVTADTLHLGGLTPGAPVATGQMTLPSIVYRVLVDGVTPASGYNLAPSEDS